MTNLEVFTERLERQKADREKFIESCSPKNFKAALVSCTGCGSKIAKNYIEGVTCPVCGASMLSASNKERLDSFDARIARTEANLRQAQKSAGIVTDEETSAEATEDTTGGEEE